MMGFIPLGGGGSNWTPLTPAQPLLWLTADKGVSTSAGKVVSWTDQSGHGWVFAPRNSSFRPTFNATGWNSTKPAIQFGSSYTELINQSAGLADLSNSFSIRVYMTMNINVQDGYQKILTWVNLSTSAGAYEIESNSNLDEVSYSSGGVLLHGNTITGSNVSTSHFMNTPIDGYTFSWINGTPSIVNHNRVANGATDTVAIGANAPLAINQLTGSIVEIVVYNVNTIGHDIDVLALYNNYAKIKWGGLP